MIRSHAYRTLRFLGLRLSRKFNTITIATTSAMLIMLLGVCNLDRLGDSFMNHNQYIVAVPCYEVMTLVESGCGTRSERLADAWTNLGICYTKLNRDDEAMRVENVALEMRKSMDVSRT